MENWSYYKGLVTITTFEDKNHCVGQDVFICGFCGCEQALNTSQKFNIQLDQQLMLTKPINRLHSIVHITT